MNLSQKILVPLDVMARQVGDEVVILDLASGTYFGLEPVGARIWQLAAENRSLAEILDIMMIEYEVSRENLERDLVRLLEELASRSLITVR